jgi:hypothetical protein
MSIFEFEEMKSFGKVQSVDTMSVTVNVLDALQLSALQVNHLVVIKASKMGQALIGMVSKIMRKFEGGADFDLTEENTSYDLVRVTLIGTFLDRDGTKSNVFKRTLESVPEIDSACYTIQKETLTTFMSAISGADSDMINIKEGEEQEPADFLGAVLDDLLVHLEK